MIAKARDTIGGNSLIAWEALRDEAAGCTRCPLYKPATQTVFGEGPVDAPLMFVGEQPGDQRISPAAPRRSRRPDVRQGDGSAASTAPELTSPTRSSTSLEQRGSDVTRQARRRDRRLPLVDRTGTDADCRR